MKPTRVVFPLLILSCIAILAGCWDDKELDELSVPLIAGFDLAEKNEKEHPDDKYLVSVGYPRFYEKTKKDFDVETSSGRMIGETRSRRNVHLGEEMILGQLQILLLGEALLEKENIVKSDLNEIIQKAKINVEVKVNIKHYDGKI